MQEKQIFKPFAEFKEGEFDDTFGVVWLFGQRASWDCVPQKYKHIPPQEYIYHASGVFIGCGEIGIKKIKCLNFPTERLVVYFVSNDYMLSCCFNESGEFVGFETLEDAHNSVIAEIAKMQKEQKFLDYFYSQKGRIRAEYDAIKNSVAEQFPNA